MPAEAVVWVRDEDQVERGRQELEQFHERKINLIRKEGGAKLVPGEIVAPAISVLGNFMKRLRAVPAASPVTPTAGIASREQRRRDAA